MTSKLKLVLKVSDQIVFELIGILKLYDVL